MRGVTQLRGLGDLRTSISSHGRATPRQAGSLHLELYRLEKERGRLEAEISLLRKRAVRVEGRVRAVEAEMSNLLSDRERVRPRSVPTQTAMGIAGSSTRWRKMPMEY